MPVSTTEVGTAAVSDLLRAYDLHHSGSETSEPQSQRAQSAPQPTSQPENPHWWPSDRRGMPAYREASRDHLLADRPAGRDNVEGVMVTVMFLGVYLNSVSFNFIPGEIVYEKTVLRQQVVKGQWANWHYRAGGIEDLAPNRRSNQ